jgi:hypothetical protein
MTQQEIIQKLIELKVIVQIKNEYYLVDKKLGTVKGESCLNLPDKYKLTNSISQKYKYFLEDCEIPSFSTGNIVYSLRESTKESLQILELILKDPTIDYKILTNKVKIWYSLPQTTKYRIKSLLVDGIWRSIYDSNIEQKVEKVRPDNKKMM